MAPKDIVNPYFPKTGRTAPPNRPVELPSKAGAEAVQPEPKKLTKAQRVTLAFTAGAAALGVPSSAAAAPVFPTSSISQTVSDVTVEATKTSTLTIKIHGAAGDHAYEKLIDDLCKTAPAPTAAPKSGVAETTAVIGTAVLPALKLLMDYLKERKEGQHPANGRKHRAPRRRNR